MKKSRFSKQRIIGILKQHASWMTAAEMCCEHGISDASSHRRTPLFGVMNLPAGLRHASAAHTIRSRWMGTPPALEGETPPDVHAERGSM
jgi:hypothetical protein